MPILNKVDTPNYAMMPKDLIDIKNYITGIELPIVKVKDGRRYASEVEDFIINKLLQQKLIKSKQKIRSWCDIIVGNKPVNIKATSMSAADNVSGSAWGQLAWALTDINSEFIIKGGWDVGIEFAKRLTTIGVVNPNRDYYYLVINTQNTNQVIINSIRSLEQLTINPNNLPFQVNWNNNITPISYTNSELTKKYNILFRKSKEKDKRNVFYSYF